MWCSVLLQALDDAKSQGTAPAARVVRERARSWLVAGGADLGTVLQLVGLEPSWWTYAVVPVLRQAWADGRGCGRRRPRHLPPTPSPAAHQPTISTMAATSGRRHRRDAQRASQAPWRGT